MQFCRKDPGYDVEIMHIALPLTIVTQKQKQCKKKTWTVILGSVGSLRVINGSTIELPNHSILSLKSCVCGIAPSLNVLILFQAVYIAPLKALVRERMDDWRVRLQQKLGRRYEVTDKDVPVWSFKFICLLLQWNLGSRQPRYYRHCVYTLFSSNCVYSIALFTDNIYICVTLKLNTSARQFRTKMTK